MNILKTLHVILSVQFCWSRSLTATSYLLVSRVGPCRVRKSSDVVTVTEMSLYKENASTLSGEVYVTKDIEDGWNVKATMQKCHDIRNLDTCDFFKSDSIIRKGCLDSEVADVYSMFLQYVSPKLGCPVTAGNYTISNFPYLKEKTDLKSAESKISTSVFGYTYRLEGFNDDEERIFCVEAHLRLNYVRNHNWTKNMQFDITSPPPLEEGDEDEEANPDTVETGPDDDATDGKSPHDDHDEDEEN